MLDQVEARLKALIGSAGDGTLREVAAIGELAALPSVPPDSAMPAAYVIPLREDPRPSSADRPGSLGQVVAVRFGIILAVAPPRAASGDGASLVRIAEVRQAVRRALMGWTPTGAETAISYAGGELLDVKPQAVWWQDSFITETIYGGNE